MEIKWGFLVMGIAILCCRTSDALKSEAESLLAFKRKLVDKQGVLRDWQDVPDIDPCDPVWRGLICLNTSNGAAVSEINLPSSFLRGEISPSLSSLAALNILDLTDNSFTGGIPDNLRLLERLSILRLGKNSLSGSIPKLPSTLHQIELYENSLSGSISETNLVDLMLFALDLHGNDLTGNLPANRTWLQTLEKLDVSNNKLDGPLPPDLADLVELSVGGIDLSGNGFSGPIPSGPWVNRYIDLSRNNLNGSIPSGLLRFRARSYFNCSHNSLSGELNMTEFLEDSSVTATIQTLDLSNNNLVGPIPEVFGSPQTANLEYLCLQNNRFSGRTDSLFSANFPNLLELRVGGNNLSVGNVLTLALSNPNASFPRLEVMDLRGSGADGDIPSQLFRAEESPALRILDLSNNRLKGNFPGSLIRTSLRELRLQGNLLTGDINMTAITNWSNLEVLDISHNRLNFSKLLAQSMLQNFSELRELRLGSNALERSSMPTNLGKLVHLETLDLSGSSYSGIISAQYSGDDRLPSLKYLDLSNNLLEGSVPAAFGNMSQLVHFDVSNNLLSGALPPLPPALREVAFFANNMLCGDPLDSCVVTRKGLETWVIILIVVTGVILSGSICLVLGWIWRRRVDAKIHQKDIELITALLDRDSTTLMSLRELRRATNDFSEEHQIGVGGFGVVYRGTLENGSVVAIKKSRRDGSTSEDKSQFLNEVKILSQVHHRNLVRLLGCCLANKNALLVFEFIRNGTLEEHLQRKRGRTPLTWDQRLQIAFETASALDYLHSSANPPIYHLDVKSANILLDDNLNAKVADFGISKLAPAVDATHITVMHGFQGTFGYMDPESVVSSILTGKSDVYAFGVVLLELITAKRAVDRSRGEDASLVHWAGSVIKSGNLVGIIDSAISHTFHTSQGKKSIEDVAILAEQCLKFQSAERPSMKDLSRDLLIILQSNK